MASLANLLKAFQPGESIFIPGASAEPRGFTETLAAAAPELPNLEIINSFLPGINGQRLAAPDNLLSETTPFPRPKFDGSRERLRHIPLSYYGFVNHLAGRKIDWVIAHVSMPDKTGYCSLGLSAEFMPQATQNCVSIVGLLNKRMPYIDGAPKLHVNQFKHTFEVDSPLVTYNPGPIDEVSARIAANVANLIEPNSTLQLGLGKVPNQLLTTLHGIDNLAFHSGMLSDGFSALHNAGALKSDFIHTTCCALGSQEFYSNVSDIDSFAIEGVEKTHAPETLAKLDGLTAINSALEVDVLGQANLESINGRSVSSVGGAADFARAARISSNGKSIIALPSTTSDGTSRIRSTLPEGSTVSLGRYDIDYVVTEHGVAHLSKSSVDERHQALISIAAPQFRDELSAVQFVKSNQPKTHL